MAGRRPRAPEAALDTELAGYLQAAPLSVCLWRGVDGEFYIADVNAAACELVGLSRDELVGARPEDVSSDHARAKRDLTRALRGETRVTREFAYVNALGGAPLRLRVAYGQAGPDLVVAFLEDVTDQRVAEERLRASEERYRQLVAAAGEGVWLVDQSGRTTFANGRVGRILGCPMVEIIGGDMLTFVDERDRTVVRAALECPRDTPAAFEARFRHCDGHELLCLLSVSPVPTEVGTPATLCIVVDMTSLKRERDLREASERRFRRMVETAYEGVWTGDRDGRTTFVNRAAARMLGLDPDAVVGRMFSDFVGETDAAAAVAVKRSLERDGQPVRAEVRLKRDDGTHVDAIASLSLMRDEDGEIAGSIAMVTDVTQLRREHAELRESRERFAHVFEDAPVGIVFIAAGRLNRGRFLAANDAFQAMLGYSAEALLEHDLLSVTHPDEVEAERALARRVFEGDETDYQLEKRYVRPSGDSVWARFRVAVVRDERGTPLYGLGVAVDISAEKAAAREAADATARAEAILDRTPDAVLEIGPDRTVKALNGAAVRVFGADEAELVGRDAAEALSPPRLAPELAALLDEWFEAARDGDGAGGRTDTTLARADASEFPADLRLAPIGGPDRFMLYVRNLGAQDRAEAARREAEERFERIFNDGATAIAVIDLNGRLTKVNPAFCRLADRALPGLLGRTAPDILEDAGDAHEIPWRTGAERPGPLRATRRIVRADGRTVTVDVVASVVHDADGAPLHWICQCIPHGLGQFAYGAGSRGEPLSYRERQVLGLLARGQDGPAIAVRLGLSSETVRSYANSARHKIGAKTRTEAVALALARGEITL